MIKSHLLYQLSHGVINVGVLAGGRLCLRSVSVPFASAKLRRFLLLAKYF